MVDARNAWAGWRAPVGAFVLLLCLTGCWRDGSATQPLVVARAGEAPRAEVSPDSPVESLTLGNEARAAFELWPGRPVEVDPGGPSEELLFSLAVPGPGASGCSIGSPRE